MNSRARRLGGWFGMVVFFCAAAAYGQPGVPGGGGGGSSDNAGLNLLDSWPFSGSNLVSSAGYNPLAYANISFATNGNGVVIDSASTSYLQLAVVQSDGHTNFALTGSDATIYFWFNPSWSSLNQSNGSGLPGWGRLFEVGQYTPTPGDGWLSLYLSSDGESINLSAEDTNGNITNYLSAPISWTSQWHMVALTVSSTNDCNLYCDGVLVTNGPPLSLLPDATALSGGLALGSDLAGTPQNQADGMFGSLTSYSGAMDASFIRLIYETDGTLIYGVTNFSGSAQTEPVLPTATNVFQFLGGLGDLEWLGSAGPGAGGPLQLTNIAAAPAAYFSSVSAFTIAGGTNGMPYDVFGTADFVDNRLADSQWFWLGQGYTGNSYMLEGQPAVMAYYILGTGLSCGDGLTEAYDLLVLHIDPTDPDYAYSGMGNGWYLYYGLNPLNPIGVPQVRLGYWRFNTNTWQGEEGQLPVVATNVASAPSWSGTAVRIDTNVPANLRYYAYQPGYMENINCKNGTVRFWLNPDWSSSVGPGSPAQLLEMGDGTASGGYWALSLSADGTQITFQSATNNVTTTYFTAGVDFTSNTWHQLALTYSAGSNGSSVLYVDGAPVATGPGIVSWPSASARAAYGFNLGSSRDGTHQSRASFDELETFNFQVSSNDIASEYAAVTVLNPVPQPSFTNQFVNNGNQIASIRGYAAAMAVQVDNSNFASPNWVPFATNCTVNLGSSNTTHQVWFGFASMNGQTAWIGVPMTVNTNPPTLVITNPVAGLTTSVPLLQLQGYCLEPLSSVSYTLSNAAGVLSNQPAYVTSQTFDTNAWDFTTNYFQAYDLVLTNGSNNITVYATDRAGNTTVSNLTCVLAAGTNAPAITGNFPTNNAAICAGSFTLDGWLDAASTAISVTAVDSSGNTNIINGQVERSGRYWVENVPLSAGTNQLTVTATDVWGNTTTSNMSVVQGSVSVTDFTVDPNSLFQPTTTVYATVSEGTVAAWVNGVEATLTGDPQLTATNVPVNDTGDGTICFIVVTQDSSGNLAQVSFDIDKPDRLYTESYQWSWTGTAHSRDDDYLNGAWDESWTTSQASLSTANNQPGSETAWTSYFENGAYYDGTPYTLTNGTNLSWTWPPISYQLWTGVYLYTNQPGTAAGTVWINYAPVPYAALESCDFSCNFTNATTETGIYSESDQQYHRQATTVLKYYTGGKALPGVQNLFEFHTSAYHINNPMAQPLYITDSGTPIYSSQPIPGGTSVGSLGKTGSDATLYTALPNNALYDVSVKVPGDNHYFYTMATPIKHILSLTANGQDIIASNVEVCVGQQVVLSASWSPALPTGTISAQSWLPSASFINQIAPPIIPGGSPWYNTVLSLLQNNPITIWWYDGGSKNAWFSSTNTMPNGQVVPIGGRGGVSVYRPTLSAITNYSPVYATNASDGGNFYLSLGNNDLGRGIMKYDVAVYSKYTGRADIRQLINRNATNGTFYTDSTGGATDLDTTLFYITESNDTNYGGYGVGTNNPRVLYYTDSPGEQLVWPVTIYTTNTSIADRFTDYVIFRPDIGNFQSNIFVSLGKTTWSWSAFDTFSDASQTWSSPQNATVSPPAGFDNSDDFPEWLRVYIAPH